MRSKICMILLVLLTCILTACSGVDKKVPDAEIEYVVEEYLYENTMDGCVGTSFEAIHDWNEESKTDCVLIEVVTEYAYGKLIAECECDFQYDKASDIWYVKRMGQWSERIDYSDKFEGAVFSSTEYQPITVEIESIDFATGEMVWNYDICNGLLVGHESSKIAIYDDSEKNTVVTVGGAERKVEFFSVRLSSSFILQVDLSVRGLEGMYFLIL